MPQPFRIKTTAFSATELLLESFSCSEALGALTEISASLLSPRSDLEADRILGKPVTFEIELRDAATRHLNGFVTRFALTGATGRHFRYQAVVRPWLWFLTRTTDCRIFQDMKVPDIVKAVFDDHPIAVHDFKLFRTYRTRDYCVQYGESDFAFVSRLLEHEGIYYRFEHRDGEHKLILLDSASAHDPQPDGADDLRFFSPGQQPPPDIDFIDRWAMTRSVQPGKFVIKDFDFEVPASDLLVSGGQQRDHDLADFEAFDYRGIFNKTADGVHYLENRRDEAQSRFEVFSGSTNAQSLANGFTFKLKRHPRADQNAEYLVTSTDLQASNGSLDAGLSGGASFQTSFTALRTTQQFRPLRRTPKAVMRGPQTAIVVGRDGDEIHTDKLGRVRVQFHWDRLGKKNEKSSCMVRVAQQWAGKQFGAMFIPRVGHEVIVDFLEGDPDQPIITGSVYNGDNPPPWKLPEHATQSGWLTRSSKGGAVANANMIQFEDKKGSEALNVHAERNMSLSAEADQALSAGRDQSTHTGRDQTLKVGRNQASEVMGTADQTVHGKLTQTFLAGQLVTVDAGFTQFISAYSNVKVTGWRHEHVDGPASRYIHDSSTNASGGDMKLKSNTKLLMQAGADFKVKAVKMAFVADGDIDFRAAKFNRVIGEGNDTILGNNTNGYIGHAKDTKMGIAETTFIGLKRDTSLAAGIYFDGGLKMGVAAGLALDIKTVVGISMEVLELKQSGLSLDLAGMKILSGGGGGGGGAAGGGAVGASAIEGVGVAAAVLGAAGAAYRSIADLKEAEQAYAKEGGTPATALALGLLAGGVVGAAVAVARAKPGLRTPKANPDPDFPPEPAAGTGH